MSFGKIFGALVVIGLIVWGFYYFKNNKTTMPTTDTNQEQTQTPADQQPAAETVPDTVVATIETNLGSFEVTLNGKAAPKTVANFIKLATEGYCNNTKFHRIIKDFVIQGCDPNSKTGDMETWGQGGPGYTIPAEIGLKANVGAIGMASTQAKGPSSGSQFFIVTKESADVHASLDGNYTFFGYVTKGMDVVTKIAAVPVQPNLVGEASLPINPVIINKITIK